MISISPPIRIGLCLACIAVSIFFLAMALGLVPDYYAARLESRKSYCEQLAIHCSLVIQREDPQSLREIMQAAVRRNSEVQSAAVRRAEGIDAAGVLLFELGDHQSQWDARLANLKNPDYVAVPIYQGSSRWGVLELRFQPLQPTGWNAALQHPAVRFYAFFGGSCALAFFFFVRFLLRQLDSTQARVVPKRV